jgi:hypothetical protein
MNIGLHPIKPSNTHLTRDEQGHLTHDPASRTMLLEDIACHVIIPKNIGDIFSRPTDFFSEMYNEKIF